MITGTGLVQAAVAASYAIAEYKPDAVVSTGSAGSFGRFSVGDIASFSKVISPDNDLTRFHLPKGAMLSDNHQTIVTLPLVSENDYILSSSSAFESGDNRKIGDIAPDAADMEAFGVAYAAYKMHIPCLAVKMITDIIGEDLRLPDYSFRLRKMREELPSAIEKALSVL